MAQDKLEVEILADGTIKLTSDPVSAPNHASAAEFFKTVARLSGGEVKTSKRKDKVHHNHAHEHEHSHE
jgi:hypothetical protein